MPNRIRSRIVDWTSFAVLTLATAISCNLFNSIRNATKDAFAEINDCCSLCYRTAHPGT
jgi:hypothetical protein